MTSTTICAGTGTAPTDTFKGTGKLFGVLIGKCSTCGKTVRCRKGTRSSTPHRGE